MSSRTDPLTAAAVLRGFTVLRQHFKQPDIGDVDSYVQTYVDACRGLTGTQFLAAVDRYVQTTERPFWPLPAMLAKLAVRDGGVGRDVNTPAERYALWSRDPWAGPSATGEFSDPCPICGVRWSWRRWRRGDGVILPPILSIQHHPPPHKETGVRFTDSPRMKGWTLAEDDQ